jgi:hypothetical protein
MTYSPRFALFSCGAFIGYVLGVFVSTGRYESAAAVLFTTLVMYPVWLAVHNTEKTV